MKATLFSLVTILCSGLMLSFKPINNANEVTVTVTYDRPIEFDMVKDGKVKKSIQTPYEFTITGESRMLFKEKEKGTVLKIKVERKNSLITCDWPVTVVLVDGDKITSFGLD